MQQILIDVIEANRPGMASSRSSYELTVLNDVARTLNASVDLSTLLTRALEKVAELLGLETGWVLLFDEHTGEPYLAASQNLPPGLDCDPGRMAGWCMCLESFRQGRLPEAANVGVVACSRLRKLALAQGNTTGLRFHASIPLKVYDDGAGMHVHPDSQGYAEPRGDDRELDDAGAVDNPRGPRGGNLSDCRPAGLKRIGMLNVASPEWRELTDDELSLLHTIGDVLGVAVERARLHARRLEAVQTEERNRIARDIHDTIAQDFSAIAFRLEAAEALLDRPGDVERVRDSITAALHITRKGLEEARRSVLDLRAAPLEGRTLPVALAALASEADATHAPTVRLETIPPATDLSPAVEIGLYRVAQEALQNALTHADAGTIHIRLRAAPSDAALEIEDDGRGFNMAEDPERRAAGRFGLIGMGERVRLLGGTFEVESTAGAGTRVTAKVPLDTR